MWMITPTHAVVIALLTWMLLCWIRIWSFTPEEGRLGTLLFAVALVLSGVIRVVYAFFGMYLLDIVFRICFLGMFSPGRLGYIATPILLCIAIGVLYIVCSTFIAPSWVNLLAFGGMALVYLHMTIMVPDPQLRIALHVGIALALIFGFIELSIKWRENRQFPSSESVLSSQPLWDLSHKFNYFAATKPYAIVLFLISIEFVLELEGMSLLYWL